MIFSSTDKIASAWNYTLMNLSEGIILFDAETKSVIQTNQKASYFLGVSFARLNGMSIRDFITHPDIDGGILDAVLEAVYHKETFIEKVVSVEVKDAGRRDIRLRSSFLRNEHTIIGIIVFMEDITDLTEMKKELVVMEKIRKLNTQLEYRNEYIRKVFGQYMSDTLLSEILDKPSGTDVLAREAVITVLMSDLRGFTAACINTEPKLMFDALNNYLSLMSTEINNHHGLIIELLGDGILAIFGAPVNNENHAADAVAAAICMQNTLEKANEWNRMHGVADFEMGISVNTGKMFVGNIGSEQRKKYAVMGSNVNLCGRIESYCTNGDILISQATKEMIHSPLVIDRELKVFPKGVDRPITVSCVRGMGEPYNLKENFRGEYCLIELAEAIKLSFRIVYDKHVGDSTETGVFIALSPAAGIFETDCELSLFDNVEIDIGAQLFGKISEKNKNRYTVIFTSKPVHFDAWLKDACGRKKQDVCK